MIIILCGCLGEAAESNFTHVAMVHHETSSGVINHIESLSGCGKATIIDAVSAMGGIPANYSDFDFVAGTSDKCLEGASGVGVVLVKKASLSNLQSAVHVAPSLALDLKVSPPFFLKFHLPL